MTKELFEKFLNNNCTSKELQKAIQWIKKDEFNTQGKELSFNEWKKYQDEEYISNQNEYDSILDKIHHNININNSKSIHNKNNFIASSTFQWLIRTAAVLLLPVSLFLFFVISHPFNYTNTFAKAHIDSIEVIAPIGSKTIVQLEDGTQVYLNHGSRLKYPQKFIGNKREVQLSGEGYFEVAHNPSKPFYVKTKKLNVIALGTSFNVMAYENEITTEITLVEGIVKVEETGKNKKARCLGEMKPGQYVCYNSKTMKISSTTGEIKKHISWKDGKLIFKNDPIDLITRRLSKWYNVDFIFTDEKIKSYTYTATFNNETLTQILDLMSLATPISYEITPRKKLKNGTYMKQKITIKLKKQTTRIN